MMFIPPILIFLAVFCAIIGYRHDEEMFKNLAIVLVIAAIAAAVVTFMALSAL
jgi:uncharacterized membrane protein